MLKRWLEVIGVNVCVSHTHLRQSARRESAYATYVNLIIAELAPYVWVLNVGCLKKCIHSLKDYQIHFDLCLGDPDKHINTHFIPPLYHHHSRYPVY